MGDYSSGDEASLPTDSTNLDHVYDGTDLSNVGTNDTNYVDQTGSAGYELHQYKDSITAGNATVTWIGKSSLAPSSSKVQLQVYKVAAPAGWQDVSGAGASNNVAAADTDFTLSGTIATADYLDSGVTTFRIYQSSVSGIQLGANLLTDGNMELAGTTNWPNYGLGTATKNTTTPINGSQDLRVQAPSSDDGARQVVADSLIAGKWYRAGATHKAGNAWGFLNNGSSNFLIWIQAESPGTATLYKSSYINPNTSGPSNGAFYLRTQAVGDYYVDDAYLCEITKSTLFTQQRDSGSSDVTEASVEVTCPNSYAQPAGVSICMDANDPSKYILGVVVRWADGNTYAVIFAVDGTSVTQTATVAVTYTATYRIKLTKSGNNVNMLYNNVDVNGGTPYVVAGYSGTIHALFNTDDDNTLGSFTLPPAA